MSTDLVLVYVPVGGGHKAAALATAEVARARGLRVEVVNLFDHAPKVVAEAYIASHVTGQTILPRVYGLGYGAVNRRSGALEPLRRGLDHVFFAGLVDVVRRLRPRAVVATHHLPLVVLGRERLEGRLRAPLLSVVTDYTAHAHWAEQGVDAFCVACPRARHELVGFGVERERIVLTGIPVRPAFEQMPIVTSPPPGAPLRVLVTSGGFGVGPVRQVVRSFSGVPRVEVTVVCGASESLADKLRSDDSLRDVDLRIVGFERDMPRRLAEAHIVVGKAGGLTVSETLTAGRPMLVVGAVPGNEKCNEAFVVDGGAGYACDARHVGRIAHGMRLRGEIGRLGAQARRLVLAGAARHVVELARELGGLVVRDAVGRVAA